MANENKQTTINDLHGLTAFLNGDEGLHEIDQDFYDELTANGHTVKILDNLFEDPAPLQNLRSFTNLVIFTTGLRPKKLVPLETLFINSKYVPDVVIFLSEQTALTFCHIARDLKLKGTRFYFVDFMDFKTLYEIEWI